MTRLGWINDGFIIRDLYGPFVVDKDNEYRADLEVKFDLIHKQAKIAHADKESLGIIERYKEDILKALDCYYRADLVESNILIETLIKDIGKDPLAVAPLSESWAFPGNRGQELQLFRGRDGRPESEYKPSDFLHLPKQLRSKTGNYRFSILGNPCWYLANSSYCCWIETGCPDDSRFYVAPVLLDGELMVFNLAISIKDYGHLDDLNEQ